jgi:dTDP-4-amino-4,6-dideoxygalactose transaminase
MSTIKKIFKTANDLAINGAPPVFKEVLHVGRPNIGDRKVFDQYVDQIFESGWLSNNGPLVQEFEQKIGEKLGAKHVVAMCNGTIALEIAIRALGLKGEVIVPSFTFIATAHALSWQGITPIFADIDPATHNLDPASVKKMITPKTTGIIGVHLWGRPAPIDELQAIADEHGLKLMFDAAHAFGSTYKGTSLGNFGECEIFSFHATKFFNSFEGGAVVTNNDKLAEQMRLMRNFGFAGLDDVIHPGTNGKMTEVVAAMGLTNLQEIDDVLEINRSNYEAYQKRLGAIDGLRVLRYTGLERFNFQYIVIEIGANFPATRNDITRVLNAENIFARKYFWPGCHNMMPYRELQPNAGLLLPGTEEVAERLVVLPTGTAISADHIETIVALFRYLSKSVFELYPAEK